MVGGTTHQQQPQQAPQFAPPSSSASASATAPVTTPEEDELLKRNTDCVYFLASPLTCKKGSECEYRHSDIARVNPRDCYYWLNGNCLNPKCAFRHPPLDGLLGSDALTPTGPAAPAPAAYATPKQGVACIFFQKGFCLKGHLCPFLHGPPNSVNNNNSNSNNKPVSEPPKSTYSGPDKSTYEPKFTQPPSVQRPNEFQFPHAKQAPKMQPTIPAQNGAVDKKVEPPRYNKPSRVVSPPVMKTNRGMENDRVLNGKDAEEYSREPSPGFDVLVDTEHGDSEYYHDKDEEFGRRRGQSQSQYNDLDRPVDYDVDRDMYREPRDYDRYNDREGQFAWDDRSTHLERSSYPRNDESDLRYRISKQRRGFENGLRSVVNRENHGDRMSGRDRHYHHHDDHHDRRQDNRQDYRQDHRQDHGALSSRLRGRIKIPGRSISPPHENSSRVEREIDKGRKHQSRYSPGRPLSLNQNRLRDRIHGRASEENNTENTFAGPKRLSELKSVRIGDSYEQKSNEEPVLGKRKFPRVESRQSEDELSFEGPKPLSEILKRKRGADNNKKETETEKKEKEKEKEIVLADIEPEKEMGSSNVEKDKSVDENSLLNYEENEEGLIEEDALLDEELEAYDDKEGEYYYEPIEGEEDYNLDEGEYVEEEEGEEKEDVVYE